MRRKVVLIQWRHEDIEGVRKALQDKAFDMEHPLLCMRESIGVWINEELKKHPDAIIICGAEVGMDGVPWKNVEEMFKHIRIEHATAILLLFSIYEKCTSRRAPSAHGKIDKSHPNRYEQLAHLIIHAEPGWNFKDLHSKLPFVKLTIQ